VKAEMHVEERKIPIIVVCRTALATDIEASSS